MPSPNAFWRFVLLPVRFCMELKQATWRVWLLISLIVVGILGTSGYFLIQHRAKERRLLDAAQHWTLFEDAARLLDREQMDFCLKKIQSLNPDDPRLAKRLAEIQNQAGDMDDPVMIAYWLNEHLRQRKLPEAAKEAMKRIESFAGDWQARCVLAHTALLEGRKEEAIDHLKELPSPLADRQHVGAGGLMYALLLHRAVNLDDVSLRMYRATRLLPIFKHPKLDELLKQEEKVQLIRCYQESFEDLDRYPDLPSYWVAAARLAESLIDDSEMNPGILTQLGELQHQQMQTLNEFKERRLLPEKEVVALQDELMKRTEAVWERVLALAPETPQAYMGLSMLANLQGDFTKAAEWLTQGQAKCPDRNELLLAQSRLLRKADPEYALYNLEQVVSNRPATPTIWATLVESSLAAGRPDKALQACREARKQNDDLQWACQMEARICLDLQRYADALEALRPLKDQLAINPSLSPLYFLALSRSGFKSEAEATLQRLVKEIQTADILIPLLRAALNEGFVEQTVKFTDQATQRWSDRKELWQILGDAYLTWAEPKQGLNWDTERARKANQAYRLALQKDPGNWAILNNIAWLELKAFDLPDAALSTLTPLRNRMTKEILPDAILDTLGAAYVGTKQLEEARQILEPLAKRNPKVSTWITLAQIHLQQQRKGEARRCLEQTAGQSRSPREHAEILYLLSRLDTAK